MNKKLQEKVNKLQSQIKITAFGYDIENGLKITEFEAREAVKQAVECGSIDEWDFAGSNEHECIFDASFLKAHTGTKLNCICLAVHVEDRADGHVADTKWFKDNGFDILSFQSYLTQENLQDKYNEFRLAKAKRDYCKGVNFKNLKREDYITLSGHEDVKIDPDGCITAWGDKRGGFVIMDENGKWAEIIKPLFISNDGDKWYEGDKCIVIELSNLEIHREVKVIEFNENNFKYVKSIEAAEQWVKEERGRREEKTFTYGELKTAFEQSRCNDKSFKDWYKFNYESRD